LELLYCGRLDMRGCRSDAEAVQQVLADLGIRWDGSLIEEDTSHPRPPARGGKRTSKLLVVKHENNLGRLTEAPQPRPPRKKKPREILVVKHEVDDDLESEQQSETEASPSPKKKKKRLLMADLLPRQLTCEVCYKVFTKLYRLKNHQLIHLGTAFVVPYRI
jgi:hypothetical protein